jgi:hypothetical protein
LLDHSTGFVVTHAFKPAAARPSFHVVTSADFGRLPDMEIGVC